MSPAPAAAPAPALDPERLQEAGIRTVRLQYADLHGVNRGKDIPVGAFGDVLEDGINFVEAIMSVDLRHNVIAGFEGGFPDLNARPDLSTLVRVPWDPGVAACIADLHDPDTGEPHPLDSRAALRRVLAECAELGLHPILGPELEFYLCEPDPADPRGYRPYASQESPVYTVGAVADPLGILDRMLHACVDLGLDAVAAAHEYGRSQYEINLRHGPALESADRAFRFKALVKEFAARDGLLATFMGKPFNDDEGSGFHLHISLNDADGANACCDTSTSDGLAAVTRHFIAGIIEHCAGMMVFFNPTVNAYRRMHPEALVPTRASWGHDHRMTLVRVPKERGSATRLELRLGDGAASPYLSYTAALAAGLDGVRRKLEPPAPIEGMIYDLPEEEQGHPLPSTFGEALEALKDDAVLLEAIGRPLVDAFEVLKGAELERFRAWVTDWEFAEYAGRL
jgi:glutamine synthetase